MISLVTYDLRLNALTSVKGIEAAQNWLATPHDDSTPLLVHLSRATLAGVRQMPADVANELQSAFFQADLKKERESYLQIFQVATKLGQKAESTRALVQAAQINGQRFPNVDQVIPILDSLYQRGEFRSMQSVLKALYPLQPSSMIANNLSYIGFLFGEDKEFHVQIGKKIVESEPEVLTYRTTLAFGLMLEEKWEEAVEYLSAANLDWSDASQADKSIYAMLLEQQGDVEEARKVREKIDPKSLTALERDAFARVKKLYSNEEEELPSLPEYLSQAREANAQEDEGTVLRLLNDALYLAESTNERDSFLQIYRLAMEIDRMDVACKALFEAARRPGVFFPSFIEIGPNLAGFLDLDDLGGLQQVLEVVTTSDPENFEAAQQLIYVKILRADMAGDLVEESRKLAEQNPELPSHATTHALGLMFNGRWVEALEALEREDIQWDQASPVDWAIYEVALEKHGGREEVLRSVRSSFGKNQISQVEQNQLERLRRSF